MRHRQRPVPVVRPGGLSRRRRAGRRRRALAVAALAGSVATLALVATSCDGRTRGTVGDRPTVGIVDTGIEARGLEGHLDAAASASLVPGEDVDDADGHGTEMAWIVRRAASDARLVAVKVVDHGGAATDERVARAVDELRHGGVDVVLLSLSGAEPLPRTEAAIERAGRSGVIVVAAAGNDGVDLARTPGYPGGYSASGLVTVAATDASGRLLGSSNRGGSTDVAAPGAVPTCGPDGRRTTSVGTSASAALVAATAARHRAATVDEVVDLVRAGAAAVPSPRCPADPA